MQYAELNNKMKMPMLGLGVFRMQDEQECANAVKTALQAGYRSIDTAAVYENETAVGIGIKESGVPRGEIFLTTKVWNEDQRQNNVQSAFEASLKAMQVDYVDLYLIHWPVKECFVNTWLELEKIYKSGRAKAIGVSNFHEHHLEDIQKVWSVVPVINQVECHPYLSQKPLIEFCNKQGIVPQAWSPLGASKNKLLEDKSITAIAEKYSKSPAQIILRWHIECGVVAIPKSTNPQRIKENLDIFDFSLTPEEITAIDSLNQDARVGSSPETFTF